jgi:YfiH family protein
MIHKDLGFAEIIITDTDFGPVVPGDHTFDKRLKERAIKSYPTVWMNQQHTPLLAPVDTPGTLPATDGCFTRKKNLMLVTKTADCVPIILWNEKAGMVAVLHSGWKGFLAGIIDSLSSLSYDDHPAFGEDFKAFLGPHLRVNNFEVRQDFIDELPEEKLHLLEKHGDKQCFNLTQGVVEELNKMHITDIEDCGINTYTDPKYFSYRQWCQTSEDKRTETYSTFASTIVMKA